MVYRCTYPGLYGRHIRARRKVQTDCRDRLVLPQPPIHIAAHEHRALIVAVLAEYARHLNGPLTAGGLKFHRIADGELHMPGERLGTTMPPFSNASHTAAG